MAFREKPNNSQKGRPVNADKERRIALKRQNKQIDTISRLLNSSKRDCERLNQFYNFDEIRESTGDTDDII
jgi:hypothetical protein